MEKDRLLKIWGRIDELIKDIKHLPISTASEMLLTKGNKYHDSLQTMNKWIEEKKEEMSPKQFEVTANKIAQYEKELLHKKEIIKKFNGKEPKSIALIQYDEQCKDVALTSMTTQEFKERFFSLNSGWLQEKFKQGVLHNEIDAYKIKEIIYKNFSLWEKRSIAI